MGGRYLVGCSVEEEKCSSCCVGVAVNRDGILSTSMEGGGGIPCTQLDDVIEVSPHVGYGHRYWFGDCCQATKTHLAFIVQTRSRTIGA